MHEALNDDPSPLERELIYLHGQVRLYLEGDWPIRPPSAFIAGAEDTLRELRASTMPEQQLPSLARQALVGALISRAAASAGGELERELEYYGAAVRRVAADDLRSAASDPAADIAAALRSARQADREDDAHALENALLDAAGHAVAWIVRREKPR